MPPQPNRQALAAPVEAEPQMRKSPGVTSVAHISDLHVTSRTSFSEDCWIALRNDLELNPVDLIVVTGDVIDGSFADLTHRRLEQALTKARTFLSSDLCTASRIDAEARLVVVPGNHDHRLRGFLRRGDRPAVLFQTVFGEMGTSRQIADLNMVLFAFDSNQAEWLSNGARGLVSISSTLGPRFFTIIPPGVTPA
jgi:predicted MPP superfamily phosphohydrolase